jgi:hypothetical protein
MKNRAASILVLAMVLVPGLLSAQNSACAAESQVRTTPVLAVFGAQKLTQQQADCSIELIDFMAAAVRGVDLLQVDEPMRQVWRAYLAQRYAMLPDAQRTWLASTPALFANLTTSWPQLTPAVQNQYRQAWSAALPPVLQFVEPVRVAARQQEQAWQTANAQNSGMSHGGMNYGQPQANDPVANYDRQQQINNSLAVHNYKMSIYTTDLMHAMSGH